MQKPLMIRLPHIEGGPTESYLSPAHIMYMARTMVDGKESAMLLLTSGNQMSLKLETFDKILDCFEFYKSEVPEPFTKAWPEIENLPEEVLDKPDE